MTFRKSVVLMLVFASILAGSIEPAHAFRSTKQEGFTDPDYLDFKPKVVLIQVLSENLEIREVVEDRLAKELEKRGIKVFSERQLFPPTRQWDAAKRSEIFAKFGVEAVVAVGVGASSHSVSQFGSQTWGSATATTYGNTTSVSGSATSVPFVSAKSNSSFSSVLIDARNGRTAWTTDIYTKAGGLLFAGGTKDAKAAAKAIIKGLIENNHLDKK